MKAQNRNNEHRRRGRGGGVRRNRHLFSTFSFSEAPKRLGRLYHRTQPCCCGDLTLTCRHLVGTDLSASLLEFGRNKLRFVFS